MTTIFGRLAGHQVIRTNVVLYGQATDDIEITPGSSLVLYGQVAGSLHVDAGASAEVHGQVGGDIRNDGVAIVDGTVLGRVHGGGETKVSPQALILGGVSQT